ncbi:MAG: HAD domain-containing protein [Pseudomonadota bacterium]
MLLFLDFDGVLRPRRAPPGCFHPACLANFEDLLREFAEIDVVISSDRALDAFETERLRVFVIDTLRGGSPSADA